MDKATVRNRTVGVIVIVAIVILVVPSLFSTNQKTQKKIIRQAVNPPAMPKVEVTKPTKVTEVRKHDNIVPAKGYVVQVGSFKNQKNAARLINKLVNAKYKAFAYSSNGMTRVYVGPEIEKQNADTLKTQLASKMKLKGIVHKFDPMIIS